MPSTLKKYQERPWLMSFYAARQRCNNPKQKGYKSYGARGIKFRMTRDDFKALWDRDQAGKMKQPSIDRVDKDGDYIPENCRYLEHEENWKRKVNDRLKA